MNKAPKLYNPYMADLAIGEMQDGLVSALPWLDVAFGKAERLVKERNGRRYYTPNIHRDGNEYVSLLPDSGIGNFCFFWIDDPQEITAEPGQRAAFSVQCSVIFWMDMRTIGNYAGYRNKEEVKSQILHALNGGFGMRYGNYSVTRCHELAENIYRGFTLDEVDNQFLMQPFCGFRFDGTLTYKQPCYD